MFRGVPASSRIGIGRAVVLDYKERRVVRRVGTKNRQQELCRLKSAIEVFRGQIEHARDLAVANYGESEGAILTAQIIIVEDSSFLDEACKRIMANAEYAEYAATQVLEGYVQTFAAMQDDLMRAREADFRDIKNRLLGILAGEKEPDYSCIFPGSVLVAQDLHVSTMACLPVQNIEAIVTACGNTFSHTSILARSRQIPFVTRIGKCICTIRHGDEIIVDGGAGEIIPCPTGEEVGRYRERARQQELVRKRLDTHRKKQTLTRDERRVELCAGLSAFSELSEVMDKGADSAFALGVAQLNESKASDEQHQFLAYKAFARALKGKPALIALEEVRLHQQAPYLGGSDRQGSSPQDLSKLVANRQEILVALRALLRASAFGKVGALIPKLTCGFELRLVRELLEQCKATLLEQEESFDPATQLGALIETPGAALCAQDIAKEADLIILGVDTLTAHTLAIDKAAKKSLSSRVFHPAVLRLISQTIQAAQQQSIPVIVSGESASNPMMIPFLVGCGADGIGVKPGVLQSVREQCENLNYTFWHSRVQEILAFSSSHEVVGYLKQNWAERPEAGSWQSAHARA